MPDVLIIGQNGATESVPEADLQAYLKAGWRVAPKDVSTTVAERKKYDTGSGSATSMGMGLARGASLGGTDWAARKGFPYVGKLLNTPDAQLNILERYAKSELTRVPGMADMARAGELDESAITKHLGKFTEFNPGSAITGEVVGGALPILATSGGMAAVRGGALGARTAAGVSRIPGVIAKPLEWVAEGALAGVQQGVSAAAMRQDGSFDKFGEHVMTGGAYGLGFGLAATAAIRGGKAIFGKKWAGLEETHRLSKHIDDLEAKHAAEKAAVGSFEDDIGRAADQAEDLRSRVEPEMPVADAPLPAAAAPDPRLTADLRGGARKPSASSVDPYGDTGLAPPLRVGRPTDTVPGGGPMRAADALEPLPTSTMVSDTPISARGRSVGDTAVSPNPIAPARGLLDDVTERPNLTAAPGAQRVGGDPMVGPVSNVSPARLKKALLEGTDPRMGDDVLKVFKQAVDDGLEGNAANHWIGRFREIRKEWLKPGSGKAMAIAATTKGKAARRLGEDLQLLGKDARVSTAIRDDIETLLKKKGDLDLVAARELKVKANGGIELPEHGVRLAPETAPAPAPDLGARVELAPDPHSTVNLGRSKARRFAEPPPVEGATLVPTGPEPRPPMGPAHGPVPRDPTFSGGSPDMAGEFGGTGGPWRHMADTAVRNPLEDAVIKGELELMRKLKLHKTKLAGLGDELAQARSAYAASLDGVRKGPAQHAAQGVAAWKLGGAVGGGFGGYLAARGVMAALHSALRPLRRGLHAKLATKVPKLRDFGRNAAAAATGAHAVTGRKSSAPRILNHEEYQEAAAGARGITDDMIAQEMAAHEGNPIAQEHIGRIFLYIRSIAPPPGPATTKNRVTFSLRFAAAVDPESAMQSITDLAVSGYQVEAMVACHPDAFSRFQDQVRYQVLRNVGDDTTYTDRQRRTVATVLGQPAHMPIEALSVFHKSGQVNERTMQKNQQLAAARSGNGATPKMGSATSELARSM